MFNLNKFLINLFNKENYPTYYKYNALSNYCIDVNLFRLISSFLALSITFLVILPGFRGKKFPIVIRWGTSLIILFLILFCNLMPYWKYGQIQSRMPYRFGYNVNINATIGLNIGLRGINITLIGNPINQYNDIIDYNEYFDWTWSQGKPGFGYDAGNLQKNYRKAQFRGLPYPILWIVETFTIDYESIHFGRYYRKAGWLAHIFLWAAIPLFILCNILFQMVIYYGSLFIIFTGISLLTSNIVFIYYTQNNDFIFKLSFENGFLYTHYSWCFYLNLFNSIFCIMIGIITIITDLRLPDETAEFFGNDVLQSYEDYFADPQDNDNHSHNNNEIYCFDSDNEVLLRRKKQNDDDDKTTNEMTRGGLKKRTLSNRFSRFQKSTIRLVKKPDTAINNNDYPNKNDNENDDDDFNKDNQQKQQQLDEIPLYENFRQFPTIGEEKEEEI